MTVGELRRKLTELPENLNRIAVPDIMNIVDVMRDVGFAGIVMTTQLVCSSKGDGMTVPEVLSCIGRTPDDELVVIKTDKGRDIFSDELVAYGEDKGSFQYI